MKIRHGISMLLASTLLLSGCTTDKGEIKNYNKQVKKAFDHENKLPEVGKALNHLEEEKQKQVKGINGKTKQEVQDRSKKLVKNVKERQKEFGKEEDIMHQSEKEFKKAHKYIDNIGNKKKRQEVKELDDALKDKYKAHDKYVDRYKAAMNKEKAMFEYTAGDDVQQKQIDKKSKAVSNAFKSLNKAFKDYSHASEKVKREKEDVDQLG